MNKLILSLIVACSLMACNTEHAEQKQSAATASQITTTSQTYKIISYPYTPFVIRDDKGMVSGFETEILQAIAKKQHIQFEFYPMLVSWDMLFHTIESKKGDLLSAAMYPNPERQKRFEISHPYMDTQFALLAKKGAKIHDLNAIKNKKIAVMPKSMAEKEILELPFADTIDIVPITSIYSGVEAVINGSADVLYGDKMVLTYYANQFKNQGLVISANPNAEPHQFVFLITKGNTELLEQINAGLAAIEADGTLDKIKAKWFKQ